MNKVDWLFVLEDLYVAFYSNKIRSLMNIDLFLFLMNIIFVNLENLNSMNSKIINLEKLIIR